MVRQKLLAISNRWSFTLLNGKLLWRWLLGRQAFPRYEKCQTVHDELTVHRNWLAEVYLSLRRMATQPENADLPRLEELRDAYGKALDLTDTLIGVNEQLRTLQFALRNATGERVESLGYDVVGGLVIFRRLWQERQTHLKVADEIVTRWTKEVPFSRLSMLEFHVQSPLPRRQFPA